MGEKKGGGTQIFQKSKGGNQTVPYCGLICKTSNDGNVLPVLEFRMALNMNGRLIATLPMDFTLTSLNMRPEIYFLPFIAI